MRLVRQIAELDERQQQSWAEIGKQERRGKGKPINILAVLGNSFDCVRKSERKSLPSAAVSGADPLNVDVL